MTIGVTGGGTGYSETWEDTSGGFIQFVFTHPVYTSTHKFHIIPFSAGSRTPFNSPPAGTTASVQDEADNLFTLLAALYHSTTSLAATQLFQVQSDNVTVFPFAYSLLGTSAGPGTAAASDDNPWVLTTYSSLGVDGSRWQLHLPGLAGVPIASLQKEAASASSGAALALAQYLGGQTNGPTHASKTNVVTHSGAVISYANMNIIGSLSKRIRRHFKQI